jgi:hypothetical protein
LIKLRRRFEGVIDIQRFFVEQRTAPIERQGRLTEHKVTNLKF